LGIDIYNPTSGGIWYEVGENLHGELGIKGAAGLEALEDVVVVENAAAARGGECAVSLALFSFCSQLFLYYYLARLERVPVANDHTNIRVASSTRR
jgi:hypothetical protein